MHLPIDDRIACSNWLASVGILDFDRGYANLVSILEQSSKTETVSGSPQDGNRVDEWLPQLENDLRSVSDPDRALNNLEKLMTARRESLTVPSMAMTLFSDSQYVSDLLIQERMSLPDLVRVNGQPVSRQSLVEGLSSQLEQIESAGTATAIIRNFKQQQTARIAVGDLIHGQPLEIVTHQISWLAEAVCESTLVWSRRQLSKKYGIPQGADNRPAQFVALALGKLGGSELNYSSDIDLVLIYDCDGHTDSIKPISNREFFERLTRELIRILSEPMIGQPAYRVDLRLRPEGSRGRICSSYQSITHYYDFQGRTWERQALIKAKPIAGDLELGGRLLNQLQPWIYQTNLNRVDIEGIKALKRQIERKTIERGEAATNVKTGHGGIRDVEFVIQFLQLLNGGVIPKIQAPNTLTTIMLLENEGCLNPAEATLLAQSYRWLRKLEHRLQLMYDLPTHTLPTDEIESQKIARRMGYRGEWALSEFKTDLMELTHSNRKILNHLLHDAFGNRFGSLRDSQGHLAFAGEERVPAEVDLILEPNPDSQMITDVLTPFGFKNTRQAFECLMESANENTPFLSSRRCRHFLAAIAPALLDQIAKTPDPDATLVSLTAISRSLGAKGVLWELFSFNPPTLSLYIRLCATSDYLAGILKTNPGMIDELMDALQVEQLPSFEFLSSSMSELVQGADDIEPIVHSFKNAQHLREGIRDILGRDEISHTHRALADVADVCLQTIAGHEYLKLCGKLMHEDWVHNGYEQDSLFVILALGKLGGREPNYHSDLDLIFLYHNDTRFEGCLADGVDSQFFFGQLSANITQTVTGSVRFGKLYELDSRLRPMGKNSPLAVSLDEFSRYFQSGTGRLWERQALCKSRVVFGSEELRNKVEQIVEQCILVESWQPKMLDQIADMRAVMEQDCSENNLKRGVGGAVDVEFIVQMLQLKFSRDNSRVLVPGTLAALEQLISLGFMNAETGRDLAQNYQLLRNVESRLRLINTTARHDLPMDVVLLKKLAFLMDIESPEVLCETIAKSRQEIRRRYNEIFCG